MKKFFTNIIIVVAGFVIGSCQKDLPNQPKANQTPSTRMWISSQTELNETLSRQHVHFYGEDPDGYVKGFLIAVSDSGQQLSQIPNPDTLTYSWVKQNDTVISIPLRAKRSKFTIIVRAVDNNFQPDTLSNHSIIKGFPNPYWDKDENGVFSSGDVYLPKLQGAIDPKGAIQVFPIVNTPPNVQFSIVSVDNPVTIEQADTTYTVAGFSWVGTDDDGHQTLKNYRLALNDTSDDGNWFDLPSSAMTKKSGEADTVKIMLYVKRQDSDNATTVTEAEVYTGIFGNLQFRGKIKNLKLNSENVLYLKVKDLADDSSATIRMPSTNAKKWYVKKPKSRMLVVADFGNVNSKNWIINYYRNIFTQNSPNNKKQTPILNDQLKNFDVFDRSHFPNSNFYNPTLVKTFQLFDVILWFTDIAPNINAAQTGLFYYTNTLNAERNVYGRAIFTTQFQNEQTYAELRAYNDFAPLDSISSQELYTSNRLSWKKIITITKIDTLVRTSTGVKDSIVYSFIKDSTSAISVRIQSNISGYPPLYVDSLIVGSQNVYSNPTAIVLTSKFKRLYKRTDSQFIYTLDSNYTILRDNNGNILFGSDSLPKRDYKGQLDIGIIDNQKRFVMFGLPLHLLNGWEHNLPQFFKKVIEDEFGLQ